jgi:phosphoribosyl-AMP cyclohydrolase / phosphoribosyl-ATP pyrophosphohydrolase
MANDIQSDRIAWNDDGLVPGIVQDARTGEVRMLGFLNEESFRLTVESGEVHFFSRSRNQLWKKGETSGNVLRLVDVRVDCDGDALLLRVIPEGPTCHTGAETCFYAEPLATGAYEPASALIVDQISATIASRHEDMPEDSYTTYLFQEGIDKIGKKIGEEAAEVIIAAKNGEPEPLAGEAADLLYHLLVMLHAADVPLDSVWETLRQRHGHPPRAPR